MIEMMKLHKNVAIEKCCVQF